MSKTMEVSNDRRIELFPLKERQKHLDGIREEYKRTIMVATLANEMYARALTLDELITDKKDPRKMKLSQRGQVVSKMQEHFETIENSYKALDEIARGDIVERSAKEE